MMKVILNIHDVYLTSFILSLWVWEKNYKIKVEKILPYVKLSRYVC